MLAAPKALKLDEKAINAYQAAGTAFLLMNAVTDTPVALKPLLHFKDHQKADALFLSGLALLTATPMVRKHEKTSWFHFGFFAVAVAHYLLTDYNAAGKKRNTV